jgi:hypothetical protein
MHERHRAGAGTLVPPFPEQGQGGLGGVAFCAEDGRVEPVHQRRLRVEQAAPAADSRPWRVLAEVAGMRLPASDQEAEPFYGL